CRAVARAEVVGGFQPRLCARFYGSAHGVCLVRQPPKRDGALRRAFDTHVAVDEFEVFLGDVVQLGAGKSQNFAAHTLRRGVDGVAGDDRAAAGKCARAPVELVGVAGDDVDVGYGHAQLIGHNLGIRGEMTLALGADTGGDADTTIRLYLNPRALIRPNAGSLDVADKPQPQVATRTARLRLCCGEELPVADEFHRQVQGRFVITAVIG